MLLRHDAIEEGCLSWFRVLMCLILIMTKTCPRCGKTFECVHSIDCWCVKVKLTDATKAYLKENYSDCLCKDCLNEINGK